MDQIGVTEVLTRDLFELSSVICLVLFAFVFSCFGVRLIGSLAFCMFVSNFLNLFVFSWALLDFLFKGSVLCVVMAIHLPT